MKGEVVYEQSLFTDCATKCVAYATCGGFHPTAPCGCVHAIQSGNRYKCDSCYLICRDAERFDFKNRRLKDFEAEIADGFNLDQVIIKQSKFNMPVFVPSYTDKINIGNVFTKYVAVDLRMMFNCSKKGAAKLKPFLKNSKLLRERLRVSSECQLVAVLNGFDWMLESLWASDRVSIFKQLYDVGFTICTGPTFSITALTTEGAPVPFSHHTAMYMRHHKIMSEIADAGLSNVPNLYWLDRDVRMMQTWADWLCLHPEIYLVSKDFTSTRQWPVIDQKLSELIDVLMLSGRRFHILVVGTGAANASKVVSKITAAGHGVTIITSAPILNALHGSQYVVDNKGNLSNLKCSKADWPFSTLITHNLEAFEKDLQQSIFTKDRY